MNRMNDIQSEEESNKAKGGGSRKPGFGENSVSKGSKSAVGFKTRIFRVYYWMSRDRNTSQTIGFLLIIGLFAQIYDLLISPIMKLPFKGSLYKDFSAIFDVVRIYSVVISLNSPSTYWIFMYLPLAITTIYIMLLLLLD